MKGFTFFYFPTCYIHELIKVSFTNKLWSQLPEVSLENSSYWVDMVAIYQDSKWISSLLKILLKLDNFSLLTIEFELRVRNKWKCSSHMSSSNSKNALMSHAKHVDVFDAALHNQWNFLSSSFIVFLQGSTKECWQSSCLCPHLPSCWIRSW